MILALGVIILLVFLSIIAVLVAKNINGKVIQLSFQNRLLQALRRLDNIALSNTEIHALFQGIVDAIHEELGFTFAVLAVVDKKANSIKRVAISLDPDSAEALHQLLPVKFHEQIVPLSNTENIFTKVVLQKKAMHTNNLYDVQIGVLPEEVSLQIQQKWNLKSIFVHPLVNRGEVIGILEYTSTKEKGKLLDFEVTLMEEFTNEVSRILDNALLYQSLGQTSRQLEQANGRLKELDQLKDDFVSIASHELRTPMTAIRSYVWMALHRSDIPLSQKLERYLYRTLLSTERLINLVNDMLNISRIEAGRIEINPKPIDIVSLTKEIAEEVKPKVEERKIDLIIKEQKMPPIFADVDKLYQVLLNLIGNSLKFTPPQGKIIVSFFTDGILVDTTVTDTGKGISKDDLSKLFKKFGRLDNSYVAMGTSGGTGLGLYICKNLIDLMHGKIWATSEGFDKGSTFTFSLPVASEKVLKEKARYTVKPIEGEVKPLEPVAL